MTARTPRPVPRQRARAWGVRTQATAAAVLTLAVVLAAAGALLLVLLKSSLIDNARDLAVQRLETAVQQLSEDDSSDLTAQLTGSGTQITQLLRTDGSLAATSDDEFREPLYAGGHLSPGQRFISAKPGLASLTDLEDHVVAASGVSLPHGEWTVVVAIPTEVQREAVSTVGWFLLGGVPVLLTLAGGLIWVLVGRSLRPVERIRATVAGISREHLSERVEVPPTRDEIERLATTMNSMLTRLESADRAQRRFVTNASHELRSPLSTLGTGLEVAAADGSGKTWRETIGILQTQVRRMGHLVEDLLTLSKLDDAGLGFTMLDTDLDDVLHEELLRIRAVSQHTVTASLVPARVTADTNRLTQVFRNVLNNADRHAESRIDVALHCKDGYAVVRIDNDGDTIPADQRENIFDRFVRLDASRTRESGGSGLGLAISREILQAHGGTISALETDDGRTRFEVMLPLQSVTAEAQQ